MRNSTTSRPLFRPKKHQMHRLGTLAQPRFFSSAESSLKNLKKSIHFFKTRVLLCCAGACRSAVYLPGSFNRSRKERSVSGRVHVCKWSAAAVSHANSRVLKKNTRRRHVRRRPAVVAERGRRGESRPRRRAARRRLLRAARRHATSLCQRAAGPLRRAPLPQSQRHARDRRADDVRLTCRNHHSVPSLRFKGYQGFVRISVGFHG